MKTYHWTLFLTSAILLIFSFSVQATNGLNAIAFSSESVGMGGADIAVARDTSALNTNPAGLNQIRDSLLDLDAAAAYLFNVRHHDNFGNNARTANSPIVLGIIGYGHHLENLPLTLGIGLFVQGGAGVEYPEINTAFGTRDRLASEFGILKLSPGAAWEVTDSLSLGASVALTYSQMNQWFFPETSVLAPTPFFGFELQDMKASSQGYKLGAQYKINDHTMLGLSYTSKIKVVLEDGRFVSNMTALGLGKVTYRDAKFEGLNLPQEVGLGLAIRPTNKLLVSLELNWLDWSDAIQSTTLTASNPDNGTAAPTISITTPQNWRDQIVIATGLAYAVNEKMIFRAGYNYGKNPIPDENLSPLLATIGEHHLTLGMGYQLGKLWRMDGALEYLLNKKVTYNNPSLPFGPGAVEEEEYLTFYVTLSRQW